MKASKTPAFIKYTLTESYHEVEDHNDLIYLCRFESKVKYFNYLNPVQYILNYSTAIVLKISLSSSLF